MTMKEHNLLNGELHTLCDDSSCRINCMSDLTSAFTIYLDELDRVLFCKAYMRDKSAGWLSIFYSLCIQAKARKCLINLVERGSRRYEILSSCRNFQRQAVLLFNASSGTFDPLAQAFSADSSDKNIRSDYQMAQYATQHDRWGLLGVRTSVQYLQYAQ
jgi:hypothetical protein